MDKTAKLWHIDTEKMHFTIGGMLNGHRRGIWDARFSPSTQVVSSVKFRFSIHGSYIVVRKPLIHSDANLILSCLSGWRLNLSSACLSSHPRERESSIAETTDGRFR